MSEKSDDSVRRRTRPIGEQQRRDAEMWGIKVQEHLLRAFPISSRLRASFEIPSGWQLVAYNAALGRHKHFGSGWCTAPTTTLNNVLWSRERKAANFWAVKAIVPMFPIVFPLSLNAHSRDQIEWQVEIQIEIRVQDAIAFVTRLGETDPAWVGLATFEQLFLPLSRAHADYCRTRWCHVLMESDMMELEKALNNATRIFKEKGVEACVKTSRHQLAPEILKAILEQRCRKEAHSRNLEDLEARLSLWNSNLQRQITTYRSQGLSSSQIENLISKEIEAIRESFTTRLNFQFEQRPVRGRGAIQR